MSCDEKTGIQALETIAPTKTAIPGQIEKREFEYVRHGTTCLITNLEVSTGKIVSPSIGPTRTEVDFVEHIKKTVATDEKAGWVFVVDQLNTHMSAGLVNLVSSLCGIQSALGKKGQTGVLENKSSRQQFLADETHRVRFVYTPKHCSWMNQVEIWFSILTKKLLKRSSFNSVEELQEKIFSFVAYFNLVMSKPFRWTYDGIPLRA